MMLHGLLTLALCSTLAVGGRYAQYGGDKVAHITRKGTELQLNGERWQGPGANVYWLGLDERVTNVPKGAPFYKPLNASYPTHQRIIEALNVVKTMGGRVVRSQSLGISYGNPLSLWPTLHKRNPQAWDTIDFSIATARRLGLRIQLPLVDNYDYYHGGKFVFLRWRGIDLDTKSGWDNIDPKVMEFYFNRRIINDFKRYIRYLLTHKNKYTGLTLAEDPTIAVIETGNELCGPHFGDKWVPNSWTKEILNYVKSLAPNKLMMDGTYGVNKTHFDLDVVDIFTNHFYPLNNTVIREDIAAVESTNRVYTIGEYDWTGAPNDTTLDDMFTILEEQQKKPKSVVSGDMFWDVYLHNAPHCKQWVWQQDPFVLGYNNPANDKNRTTRIEKIRRHFFRLQGKEVGLAQPPVNACPKDWSL